MKKSCFNPKRSKICAVVTCVILLIQVTASFGSLSNGTGSGNGPEPVILYQGAPLWDGMTLPRDARVLVHYEFESRYQELSDVSVFLPVGLKAEHAGSYAVMARDEWGNERDGGAADVGADGHIFLSFSPVTQNGPMREPLLQDNPAKPVLPDEQDEPNEPVLSSEPPEPTEPVLPSEPPEPTEPALHNEPDASEVPDYIELHDDSAEIPMGGVLSDFSAVLSSPLQGYEAGENETVWVSFDIPCVLDPEQLGSTQIFLQSAGEQLSITLVSMNMMMTAMNRFGENLLEDVADIIAARLYLGNTEIISGMAASYSDSLTLTYDFNISQETCDAIASSINSGTSPKYVIPLPAGLTWASSVSSPDLFITYGGGAPPEKFAQLSIEGGAAYITFTGDFWDDPTDINDGWLALECSLDPIATHDLPSYELNLFGGNQINIFILDNKKSEHTLLKSGNYQDNRFNWAVSYIPGEADAKYPLTIRDEFDNSHHILVPDSLTVIPEGVAAVVETVGNITTISYTVTEAAKDIPVTLTYQTRLADNQLPSDGSNAVTDTTAVNTAFLQDADHQDIVPPVSKSVTVGSEYKRWAYKAGVQNGRNIDWTLTVSSLDRDLINLVLYDAIPAGLTLIADSVTVNGKPVADAGAVLDSSGGAVNGGYTATFSIGFNDSPYPPVYTIHYSTTVDDGYFDNPEQDSEFGNVAWLTFDWREYGPGNSYTPRNPPVVGNPFGAVTNVIQKTAVGYNPQTHTITWRVAVNPYHVNLYSGMITDDLKLKKQTYAGNFQTGDSRIEFISADDDVLKVQIGALGTADSWFTFDAFVENPEDFATNHDGRLYYNTADFEGRLESEVGPAIRDSASAWVTVTSQMLAKRSGGCSYNASGELEITWKLTVNQNEMPMSNARIVDTLPPGLTYVPGSVKINGAAAVDAAVSGQTITISLGTSVSNTVAVEYRTKVNPNHPSLSALFTDNNKVILTNSAKLLHDGYTVDVTASASQEVGNQILDKSGLYNTADKVISYFVNINPNGVALNGQEIKDTLPSNLRLDITSVELAEAEIQPDGTFQRKAGGDIYGYENPIFSYYLDGFSFLLPDGSKRYVLAYDCYIISGTSFDNRIEFTTGGVGAAPGTNSDNVNVGSGGGGTSSKKARLTITKSDSLRPGVKLAGVTFDVFQQVGGAEIHVMRVTTDANGIADLYPLSPNVMYVVRETGITGYAADTMNASTTGGVTVSDASNGKLDITVSSSGDHSLTITNTPATGSFSFEKRSDKDEKGNYQPVGAGAAKFKATDQTSGSNYTIEASTDATGKVTFTGLPFGKYTVTETVTPPYHTPASPFTVEIGPDGATVTPAPYGNGTATVDNTFYRPQLSIRKASVGKSASVVGIQFALYKEGEANPIETQATDANGNLKFTQLLLGGERYVVREVNTPDGYYVSGELVTGVINSATLSTVSWNNYAYAASVEITKVDSTRNGVALPGAVFELYSDSSGSPGALLATSSATGANGKATFSGLALNQNMSALKTNSSPSLLKTSFWLVEKTAPDGYILDPTPVEIIFSAGSAYTAKATKTIENTPAKAANTSLVFYKRSNLDGSPLVGVRFKLHDTTPGSTLVLGNDNSNPIVSDGNGMVTFENIPFGRYWLEEVAAPDYHKRIADQTIYVEFDKTGNCVYFNGKNNPTGDDFTVINEIYTPKLTITKVDANTGAKIAGVVFDLYEVDGEGETATGFTAATNSNGQASFTVTGGKSYLIRERNAPDDYYISEDYLTGLINSETLAPIEWKNYSYAASIKITKRDGVRTSIPIKDAEFTLYSDEACTMPVGPPKKTDGSGLLTFTGLPLKQTGEAWNGEPVLTATDYWLLETDAPDGYVINTTPMKVTLTGRKQSYTATLDNESVTGDLTFTKISRNDDRADLPLAGAEFTLTDASGYTATGVSDIKGIVTFLALPFGTYTVVETVIPEYHSKYPDFQVTIDQNGKCTFFNGQSGSDMKNLQVINIQKLTELIITKVDQNGGPLPDVNFTLYRKYDEIWRLAGSVQATDANGKVRFENLVVGETYKIHEITPEGCYAPPDYIFTALDQPSHSFTWVNYPLEGSITVTKTDALTGAVLEGVRYGLYDNGTLVKEALSNKLGAVVFDYLALNYEYNMIQATGRYEATLSPKEYVVRELKAVDGYAQDASGHALTLTPGNQGNIVALENDRVKADLSFTKVNEWGFRLEGAEFALTGDLGNGYLYSETAASDQTGVVKFTDVPFGTYTLTETKAPADHELINTAYTVEVSKDGVVTLPAGMTGGELINEFHSGSVTIIKLDNGVKEPLAGITFVIRDSKGIERGTAVTNENGAAVFPKLMVNETYTIEEEARPGYYPSDPLTITAFTKDEALQITWNNYPGEGSVTVKVVDADTGAELGGVRFGIYSIDSQGNEVLIAEAVSGPDGTLVFTGLPLRISSNATFDTAPTLDGDGTIDYIIRELDTIQGYVPLPGPVIVSLTESSPDIQEEVEKDKTPVPTPRGRGGDTGNTDGGDGNINPKPTQPPASHPGSSQVPGTSLSPSAAPVPGASPSPSAAPVPGTSPAPSAAPVSSLAPDHDKADSTEGIGINDEADGYGQQSEGVTEIIEGVPVVIPEISTVPEQDIIHTAQLRDGYSIVKIGDNLYIIYDGKGVPLAYIILPENMTLDEIDILSEMIPIYKNNPKTGDRSDETIPHIRMMVILLILSLATIAHWRNRLMNE